MCKVDDDVQMSAGEISKAGKLADLADAELDKMTAEINVKARSADPAMTSELNWKTKNTKDLRSTLDAAKKSIQGQLNRMNCSINGPLWKLEQRRTYLLAEQTFRRVCRCRLVVYIYIYIYI